MRLIYRNILTVTVIILFSLEAVSQKPNENEFKIGIDKYTSGNYREALSIWTSLYNTGYHSAELAYNIGNAYFKLDSIPGAVLFYERALLLKPADEDISYNLQIARSLVTDKFEEIPELFFIRWYNFLSLTLSSNSWAKISFGTFLVFLFLLSVYLYSSKYVFKVFAFWTALVFLIISASTLSFSISNRSLVYDSRKAVIFCPVIHGKSSPDNSGTDLFVLHEGTKVSVEDEVGDWLEIRLSDGNKGWIPSNCLQNI